MAQIAVSHHSPVAGTRMHVRLWMGPAEQAFWILRVGFAVAPIIAGIDKFFHLLVNWDQYLAPQIPQMLNIAPHTFMQAVGVVEVIAGIGIALMPRVFAWVVALWLAGIIVNLLMIPGYYDIALRDFGLCLGAVALARLSEWHAHCRTPIAA